MGEFCFSGEKCRRLSHTLAQDKSWVGATKPSRYALWSLDISTACSCTRKHNDSSSYVSATTKYSFPQPKADPLVRYTSWLSTSRVWPTGSGGDSGCERAWTVMKRHTTSLCTVLIFTSHKFSHIANYWPFVMQRLVIVTDYYVLKRQSTNIITFEYSRTLIFY